MKTFLVVEKLLMDPGIYSAELNQIGEKASNEMKKYFDLTYAIPLLGQFKQIHSLIKNMMNYKILNSNKGYKINKINLNGKLNDHFKYNLDEAVYFPNLIVFDNESRILNNNLNVFYDNIIFEGLFQSKEHFNLIFPTNKISELFIVNKEYVGKYFPNTKNINLGLNIELQDANILVPLSHISTVSWEYITVIIREVFDNLGAKEIIIKDNTDVNANLEYDIKRIESILKTKINVALSHKFEFTQKYKEGSSQPINIEHLLPILDKYVPHIAQTAREQIRHQRKGETKFEECIDVQFGVSVDVALAFQGTFKGGFKRNLSIEVIFD